jgi:YD repeat-containing protein
MKRLMLVAGCLLLLLPAIGDVSAQSGPSAKVPGAARFVGTWKLLYRDAAGRSGESVHTVETGRLTYDERGNMTVQVAREGREKLTSSSEPREVMSTYTAYWGSYVVDAAKGTITHQIEGSLSPGMIGRPSPHRYEFSNGDQRLALTSPGSTSNWERLR